MFLIKQKATLIDISHRYHINEKCQKKFFEFRKFKKHNLVFLNPYPFQLRIKPIKHYLEIICSQTESHFHRFIQSVSYKREMSEKIF